MAELRFANREALNTYTKLRNRKKNSLQSGEKAYVKDTPYVWDGENWCEYKAPQVELSLYEINEQLVSQLPVLSTEDCLKAEEEINEWHKRIQSKYYMLLCKEQSYYTVFVAENFYVDCDSLGNAIISCLTDIGEIKAISLQDNDTYEIWVHQPGMDKLWCLHLFNYSNGIVTFYGE